MEQASTWLRQAGVFNRSDTRLLVVMSYWNPVLVFGRELTEALIRCRGCMLATKRDDAEFKPKMNRVDGFPAGRRTVIPYLAHWRANLRPGQLIQRDGLMFHGAFTDPNGDPRRGRGVLPALAAATRLNFSLSNSTVGWVSNNKGYLSHEQQQARVTAQQHATIAAMQSAQLCLVPEGDSIESRRLFDALAAGCVPILMRRPEYFRADLPFARSIPWEKVALFVEWPPTRPITATARWLEGVAANATLINELRVAGQIAFRHFLALDTNASGVAGALLSEVVARSRLTLAAAAPRSTCRAFPPAN